MKVLIIGAKGMLGSALVREFEKADEVIAWDREELDITQVESVKSKVKSLRPDLVINAAAYTDVDGAEQSPNLANAINGFAVAYVAAAARDLQIPLIHYSTEYVFDGEKPEGYREDDKPNPISAYGRSKLLGEQQLQKNTDKFYLIRLSRLFGRESDLSPTLPTPGEGKTRKKSFVRLMLESAQTKKEMDIVDEELSCPTYASDLAARTRYILENKMPFGIYHGVNSESCTWYGFAREIFEIKGIDVKLNPVPASRFPRPAKRPKYSILLNTKLPPARDWKEALKEFLQ